MKTTFRQQSLITAFLMTVSIMFYCSLFLNEANSQIPKSSSGNKYPQGFVDSYQASCQFNAVAKGLSQEKSKTICDCTLNHFRYKYTLEKFQQLLKQSTKDKTLDELIEVGELCAEQLINWYSNSQVTIIKNLGLLCG